MITLLIIFGSLALIVWGAKHPLRSFNSDYQSSKLNRWDEAEGFAVVIGGIILSFFLLALVSFRTANSINNAKLELIYSTTIHNYEITVNKTKDLFSSGSSNAKFIDGSIERTETALIVSKRLVELRDQVNRLNHVVVSKNAWSHEYLLGGFLWTPPAPKHIKPYVL